MDENGVQHGQADLISDELLKNGRLWSFRTSSCSSAGEINPGWYSKPAGKGPILLKRSGCVLTDHLELRGRETEQPLTK
jgi:hypothetical protein